MGIKRHLSPANVLSATALMVALGGTSYAAVALPNNSVGSPQIKTNAVKSSEIASSAVRSSEVKDASLKLVDFAPGQIPAGAKGDKGDKGETGSVGAATMRSFTAAADLADGTKASYNVYCPAGQVAISGGGRGDETNSEGTVLTSTRPSLSADNTNPPEEGGTYTGWRITVFNPAGGITNGIRPTVYVTCVGAPTAP
jgi:hypothetical protein